MSSDQIDPSPALHIPDHELIAKIGAGSYGEVWLARSLTGSFRAVKIVFRNRFTDARPFEREFQGILKFEPISRSHPGVIAILHVGERADEGYFYYVMEIADALGAGQKIDPASYIPHTFSTITSAPKPPRIGECIDYGLALTAALGHLHENGLAHRDIKPSNIVFVNGRPKLADIGMVTAIDGERTYLGTRGYIPPEGAGTPHADIYSLGKVLYEAASGFPAEKFPEVPATLSENIRTDQFFEFNEILLKACAPKPSYRYLSASRMHRDLESLKNGQSLRSANARDQRSRRIQRLAASALITAAVSATGVMMKDRVVEERILDQTLHSRFKVPIVKITAQPVSGTVLKGSPVAFSVSAAGEKLHYQWFHDGRLLTGETNRSLHIKNFSPNDAGRYHARIGSDLGGKPVNTQPADWVIGAPTQQKLLNVQFTAHLNFWYSPKRGPAAIGASNDDFWNMFSRDGADPQEWRTSGVMDHLKWSDGADSGATLSVENIGGVWFTLRGEPLLRVYAYPVMRKGDVSAKFSNLPPQEFDIYVYAHGQPPDENSEIEVQVNGAPVGTKATTTKPDWTKPGWTENVEYVLFRNVSLPAGADLKIISHPGKTSLAVINGIQLVKSPISMH